MVEAGSCSAAAVARLLLLVAFLPVEHTQGFNSWFLALVRRLSSFAAAQARGLVAPPCVELPDQGLNLCPCIGRQIVIH